MRSSDVLGGDIHADADDPTVKKVGYEARVTAVDIPRRVVSIIVPGYSREHDFKDLAYVSPAGEPAVGDRAIAMFTDARDPWVFVAGAGETRDASPTVKGLTKLSVPAAPLTNPVAVGTNDPRVPTQTENDALVGTSGTASGANRYVTDADPRNSNARTPLAHTHAQADITGLIAALAAKLGVSLFDAAGDLLIGSGADAVDVLSVLGAADGDVLTRDSTDPLGVIWAPASGGGGGGSEPDASATVKGVSKLSVAPASAINPIAAGTNDPRLSDTRTPTDGSVTAAKVDGSLKPSGTAAATDESLRRLGTGATHAAAGDDSRFPTAGQKNALAGTSGTPGSGNTYVTDQDARNSDTRTPTDGSVTAAKVAAALKPSGGAATTTEALRALGTAAGTAAAGNDSRITGAEQAANKGAASGYAPLDSGLLVPVANLPAATALAKGVIQLAGDLGGTAASPTVPGLTSKVDTTDTRLSDTRTPTDGSVTAVKVAAALKPSGSAAAADEAVRALGSSASNAAPGNHVSTYRTLLDASGSHTAAKVAGTYGMGQGDSIAVTGTGILYPLNVIYIASADFQTVAGITPKLRIRGQVYVNDVAPTGNFTFGLHPVTRPATSGGAGLVIYTIGAAVAGSTAAINTPAADSSNVATGADFALPADGHYVIGVVTTATVAASSHLHLSAVLQMRNA